jgi:thymidylate kinase
MRAGYLRMARNEPARIRVVDASGSAEETRSNVMTLVLPILEKARS